MRNPRHPLESHPRPRSSQRFRPGGSSSLQGCCNHLPTYHPAIVPYVPQMLVRVRVLYDCTRSARVHPHQCIAFQRHQRCRAAELPHACLLPFQCQRNVSIDAYSSSSRSSRTVADTEREGGYRVDRKLRRPKGEEHSNITHMPHIMSEEPSSPPVGAARPRL